MSGKALVIFLAIVMLIMCGVNYQSSGNFLCGAKPGAGEVCWYGGYPR